MGAKGVASTFQSLGGLQCHLVRTDSCDFFDLEMKITFLRQTCLLADSISKFSLFSSRSASSLRTHRCQNHHPRRRIVDRIAVVGETCQEGIAAALTQKSYLNCIEEEGYALNDLLYKMLHPKLHVAVAASSPLGAGPKILLRNALASQKMSGRKAAVSDQTLSSKHSTDQAGPYQNLHLGFKGVL